MKLKQLLKNYIIKKYKYIVMMNFVFPLEIFFVAMF